ncbi:MAG TPA: hypothetical protein VHV80_08305 [Steroidobacteraceae bacterium]|jgi:hypothetical protein|nr:hypothetical protein [Steroidobacteraceae bacterium]
MNIRTFVPSIHRFASLGWVLAASLGLAHAAGPAAVSRVFIVVVPPAQDQAFNQGIKDWNKCLHDHGSTQTALAYSAVTGDLDRYLFVEEHSSWADMDNHDPAGKACGPIFVSEVLPHAGQAFSEISVLNPKATYMPGGDPDPAPMLWVNAYRIKVGQAEAFGEVMAKFAAAAAKTHWQGHFAGYDVEGAGEGGLDFALVWPNKNWADIGQDPTPSIKDMMDSVYGKAASRAMHAKYAAAIDAQWADTWSFEKDLSYIPGK